MWKTARDMTEDTRSHLTRSRAEIGWYPETMFKEGIKKTIAWYFEHEDWMERVTSGDYQKYYKEMYKA